jgi:hypothetical protein
LPGVSVRKIALHLGIAESNLRRLLETLQAPREDRLLARQGKITTNELVRRAKAAVASRESINRETLERQRTQASITGCNEIYRWLRSQNAPSNDGKLIVGKAQEILTQAEQTGRFPPGDVPSDMPAAEIIQRSRPDQSEAWKVGPAAWFAFWLAEWVYRSMQDEPVRYKAVELALEGLSRGARLG